MKKLYSILRVLLFIAVVLAGSTSCIKEDLGNCTIPQGIVRISLSLDEIVSPENSLGDFGIGRVDVYVFDQENKYVSTVSGDAYTDEGYELFIDLPGGDYQFVVWTNQGDSYKTNKTIMECEAESTLKDDLEFFLSCNAGDVIHQNIPDLLYGKMSQNVINNRENHVLVPMTPNTYTVNVKAKGIPQTEDTFNFTITDNNSHYTFDNAIVGGKDNFQLLRNCMHESDDLEVSFKTLKLTRSRSPLFMLKNSTKDETLFSDCLVQTIIKAYESSGKQVDFNVTHTFDIVLEFQEVDQGSDAKLEVSVTVNGWAYDPKGQILE